MTVGAAPPLPPAADAAAFEESEPTSKPKRSRWGFGRSRKSRADKQAAEVAAPVADIAATEAEAATFAGWSVRQPNEEPQPVWQRSHDVPEATPPSSPGAEAAEAVSDDTPDPTSAVADGEDEPTTDVHAIGRRRPPGLRRGPDGHGATAPIRRRRRIRRRGSPRLRAAARRPVAEDDGGIPASETAGGDDGFEFASLDVPPPEPAAPATSESWLSDSWLDDVVSGDDPSEPESAGRAGDRRRRA